MTISAAPWPLYLAPEPISGLTHLLSSFVLLLSLNIFLLKTLDCQKLSRVFRVLNTNITWGAVNKLLLPVTVWAV